LPDIALGQASLDPTDGGLDFSYTVTGSDLPEATSFAVYWSTNTTLAGAIGQPIYTAPVQQALGSYGPFDIPPSTLGAIPLGAKDFVIVADPPTAQNPQGLIVESDKTNNIVATAAPPLVVNVVTHGFNPYTN
jgi:hypothetical protein